MKRIALLCIVCLAVVLAGCTPKSATQGGAAAADTHGIESAEEELYDEEAAADKDVDTAQPTAAQEGEESAPAESAAIATVAAAADEPVALVLVDGRYGYVNTSGEWVIAPQYVGASPFEHNVALATNEVSGGWKLIDKANNVIAEFPDDVQIDMRSAAAPDSLNKGQWIIDGMLIIARDSDDGTEYGYANTKGEIVVEPQYAEVEPFSDGLAAVATWTDAGQLRWGYVDESGTLVIPAQYVYARAFSDGLAYVQRDGETLSDEERRNSLDSGFIDHSGALVIHRAPGDEYGMATEGVFPFDTLFVDGIACAEYYRPSDDGGHTELVIIDTSGKVLANAADYSAGDTRCFSEGLYCIEIKPHSQSEVMVGFMDAGGGIVIAPQNVWTVDEQTLFSDGMCAVRTPDAVGFIDAAGNLAIAPQFAEARDFTHGLAAVVASYADDSGWHYIDKSGNIVIAGPFQEAWPFSS
jgi:hypothetical protein